jgi:TolB-like protein/Flp pilus assembly protein TadD
MADSSKAVFLSYASQDAEAARRIAESMRAAGVEVWFDQEGGLEHGDEWDRKIRKQIKECVLFLPLISAHTQEREEGYFRIEWDLAAERAQGIASGVAFILPIVIDGTREPDALVPDRFRKVQWTRLPGGVITPELLARFLKLWSHRTGVISHQVSRAAAAESATPPGTTRGPGWRRWSMAAVVSVVLAVGVTWWQRHRPIATEAAKTTAPVSEARQLVSNAWEQLNKAELARAELEVADELCKRAAALDPNDADVWAAWSQVDSWYIYHNLDSAPQRREGARTKAARALQLAPASYEARLAQACHLVRGGGVRNVSMFAAEADGQLRVLLQEKPGEPRALLALGILLRNTGKIVEAREVFGRMAKNAAFAVQAWNELGWAELINSDYRAAEAAADASIALQPYWANLTLKGFIAQEWRGDLGLAKATLERIPAAVQQEDFGVASAASLFFWRREPVNMLRVLDSVPRDWLHSNGFDGPKAYWTALAQQMAGHDEAAQVQWRTALKLVERRLADQPDSGFLLRWKGLLLAASGNRSEGETALRLAREMGDGMIPIQEAIDQVRLGNLDAATTLLERAVEAHDRFATAAMFRLNPLWDSLRPQPRFKALLAKMEADPRTSPNAPDLSAKALGTVDQKSVAVLAFDNLSDDKGNEYFSDGISEELINGLGRVPGLAVKGRTSAFYFKGKQASSAEIAQRLGVTYLVRGSVRKAGDKVRITAQLTRAADDEVLWSFEPVTRDMHDVLAVQEEIAGLIAKALSLKLGTSPAAATVVINPEAYRLYLEGRQAWNLRNTIADGRAEALFRRALQLDPNFARAHAGLADLTLTRDSALLIRDGGLRAEIRAGAERALALDPSLAEPHATLGALASETWELDDGEREFQRALALNPSYPWAHMWRSQGLMTMGRVEDALRETRLALEADPLAPRIASHAAMLALLAGRLTEAIAFADQSLALQPDGLQPEMWKAEALLLLGRSTEALTIARAAIAADPKRSGLFGYVLARAGGPQEVALATAANEVFVPNRTRALLAGGRVEEAFTALEAEATNIFALQFALFHPAFDEIRGDARFAKLLARLRLTDADARAQAWRAAHPPEKPEAKK